MLKIRALVNGEKYNEAFTAALMQSNLSLVVDTIESVDPSKIFSPDAGPNGTCLEARGDKYNNKIDKKPKEQSSKPKNVFSNTSSLPTASFSLTPSRTSSHTRPRSAKLIKSEYKLKPKALPERPVEPNYNNLTSEIISSCESFYDSDHYTSKPKISQSRKDSAFLDDLEMDLRSSTETKLSRFFLLNKY